MNDRNLAARFGFMRLDAWWTDQIIPAAPPSPGACRTAGAARDPPSLKPTRFFDGQHWEDAQRRRIAEGGHTPPAGLNGSVTLKAILDRALE
jgi:hypothetical protein